jgi:putative phage-type endonuclease
MTDKLLDITNLIIPEENVRFLNEEETIELYQTCLYLMDNLIDNNYTLITDPDFENIFNEEINELIHLHFEYDIFYNYDAEEEIDDIIEQAKCDFFDFFMPSRSSNTNIVSIIDINLVSNQIEILRKKPQPVQRTKEWYIFRHNLITASNAYKAFESESARNQLIYEKCQPISFNNDEEKEIIMVNTNTPLHWGQKYEPVSVQIYENMYKTSVEDFGCIQHEQYSFIGASPDGINIDKNSEKYGRMLEIKNIVNREINGIPKKEYWIQMQLQMEVCNLNECDFLETKFTEYPDPSSYFTDVSNEYYEDDEGIEFLNLCISKDNKPKGQMIYFHTKEGKPLYVYKPLNYIHPDDIENWQNKTIEENNNHTYMKTIYWKLENFSCVLVCRNQQWFKDNINTLQQLWDTIEKERISGYEHRAPKRKPKKEINDPSKNTIGQCLLQINKDTGKIIVIKK